MILVADEDARDALPTSITLVADILERNRIPQADRTANMIVWDMLEGRAWKLGSGLGDLDWTEVFLPSDLNPLSAVTARGVATSTVTFEGLTCYVVEDQTTFQLDDALEWQEVDDDASAAAAAAAAAQDDATQALADASAAQADATQALADAATAQTAADAATLGKRTLTIGHADLTDADGSQTLNIGATLPANARIMAVEMRALTPFSGGTAGSVTVDVGTSGDVDALIDGADLFAAAVDGGPATMPQGVRPNKMFASAGAQLIATVAADDDVADLDAGSVIIDVLYVVLA